MQKVDAAFFIEIELDDLEDYGFCYARDKPCRIQKIDYMRPNKKFKKRQTEEGEPEKIRAEVIAHNVWTDEEVWKGVINEDPIKVPKAEWEHYEVVFVDHSGNGCRLMEKETEDFEEIDTIYLPTEEKPNLVKELRECFAEHQDSDKTVFVKVLLMFGRKQIYDYYVEQNDI